MIVTKKPRRVRRRWVVALAILSVLLALAIFVGWRALDLRQQLGHGRDELDVAVAALTGKPLPELGRDDFEGALKHVQNAEAILRPARDELGGWEPVLNLVGGDAAAVIPLIDTALETAVAGQQLYLGLEPLLDRILATAGSNPPVTTAGLTTEDKVTDSGTLDRWQGENLEDLIAQLRAHEPQVREAQVHLQRALSAYNRIDQKSLSGEIAANVAGLDRYAGYLQSAHELTDVLTAAPDLLASFAGVDKPKTYLLLGQNNDELRPTGGAIGTFGLLVVSDGAILVHRYSSTGKTYLKAPTEPCPDPGPAWWIQLRDPAWGCWDAQWTADFPTLARQAKWFYEQGKNDFAPVDGVIAIDQIAFEQLLAAIGPIQLPGDSEIVTAENFRDRVYLHPNADGYEPHKEFLAGLFQAIVERDLKQIDPERAGALIQVLYQAVERKHILLYFEDQGLQALTEQMAMAGSIHGTTGDYLFVVDTSLYDKVYDSVREKIYYEARLDESGSVSARTTITWTYSAAAAAKDPAIIKAAERRGQPGQAPFLLNLTRIYLPGTTAWGSMDGDGISAYFAVEAGRLMAGTRVELSVGESKHVTHRYLVPYIVETVGDHQVYKLLVQKQPGTRGASLSVQVTLPPGAELISTAPKAEAITAGEVSVVTFRTQLTVDRTFEVAFRQAPVETVGK